MNRLRRSLRESLGKGRRRGEMPESSKPHQWEEDEEKVRKGNCIFPVKYLGCVEVFDSRGMHICEEALGILRHSRKRRGVRGNLLVTGDGLRVVEENTKGLLVDQTIEKVSFCAPDRNQERGFSYICRDGTTRRWMCHGFQAVKDSGERLSHAVGCAFTVCLERKQRRDRESVSVRNSTFTRTGSFRQASITDRLTDPQEWKPGGPVPPLRGPVLNPFAIERPHASSALLERQGSFRGFGASGFNQTSSPFKRHLSLRLNDLPSNLSRHRSMSLQTSRRTGTNDKSNDSPPTVHKKGEEEGGETISAMCQELFQKLSVLSGKEGEGEGEEEEKDEDEDEDEFLEGKLPVPGNYSQSPNRTVEEERGGRPDESFTGGGGSTGTKDPFDAGWVDLNSVEELKEMEEKKRKRKRTNPFIMEQHSNAMKTFQFQM